MCVTAPTGARPAESCLSVRCQGEANHVLRSPCEQLVSVWIVREALANSQVLKAAIIKLQRFQECGNRARGRPGRCTRGALSPEIHWRAAGSKAGWPVTGPEALIYICAIMSIE